MIINRSVLFLLAAISCFIVALCVALGWISSNETAWQDGGLALLAGSFLP